MTNSIYHGSLYYAVVVTTFFYMQSILNIVQIVLAVLLVTAILFQNRGSGLGSVFGGEGNIYRTKRGFEKGLFIGTIVLSILFLGTAIANILIRQS